MSDDHPEVTWMKQPVRTWSFMADGMVQLILKVLDLPPHTSMIQVGDEGMVLSVGVLPAEPPVMVSVTASTDGVPTVMVQAETGELWSDSNLLREERGPEAIPAEAQGKETLAEKETLQAGEDVTQVEEQLEEEPVKKKAKKQKKEPVKKKTAKAAKKA